jgi:hypothetical protein
MDKTRLNVKLGSTFETISGTKRLRSAESVPLVCVECLIGKQKKPILFKVTEPPY